MPLDEGIVAAVHISRAAGIETSESYARAVRDC